MATTNSESASLAAVSSTPMLRSIGSPGTCLDEAEGALLRAWINVEGVQTVARALDFPASTLANAAAGCGLRRANRMLLTERIRARAAAARATR